MHVKVKKVNCPHCGAEYTLAQSLWGRKAKCAICRNEFIISCADNENRVKPSVPFARKQNLMMNWCIVGGAIFVILLIGIALLIETSPSEPNNDLGKCCIMTECQTLDFTDRDYSKSFLGFRWNSLSPMTSGEFRRFQYTLSKPFGWLDKVELSYNRQDQLYMVSLTGTINPSLCSDDMVMEEFNKCRNVLFDLLGISIITTRFIEGGDRLLGINEGVSDVVIAFNFPLKANPNRKACIAVIKSSH